MGIDAISAAPFAEVISFEECRPHNTASYDCKVNGWKKRFNRIGKESYKVLPGDVIILADIKPEVATDFERMGKSWSLGVVHKISNYDESEDDLNSTSFKVKVSVNNLEMIDKSMFVVYLFNILPITRIWNALQMNVKSKIILKILCPSQLVSQLCSYTKKSNV